MHRITALAVSMRDSLFPGLLIAVAGAATPFIILWFRHRALRQRVTAHRALTEDERMSLRQRGRLSIIEFVLFWIITIGLLGTATQMTPAPEVEWALLTAVLIMAVALVARHLSIRCPICNYRTGYQRTLSIPPRCERCGAAF